MRPTTARLIFFGEKPQLTISELMYELYHLEVFLDD